MEGIGSIYLESGEILPAICELEGDSLMFKTEDGLLVMKLNEDEIIRILNNFGGFSKWIKSNLE